MKSFVLVLFICLFGPFALFSSGINRVDNSTGIYSLHDGTLQIGVLVDAAGSLTLGSILSNNPSFQKVTQRSPNYGFTDAVYWLKISLEQRGSGQDWMLEFGYPFLDYITMFTVVSNRVVSRQISGRMYPFSQRAFAHRNFVFPVSVPESSRIDLYFRIKTSSNMSLPVALYTMTAFFHQNRQSQIAMGIFYGAILVMVLYNVLLFISFRDVTYFYYVLFLVSIAVVQMGLHGLSYEYLWPDAPVWNSKSFLFFTAFSVFAICLFEKSFLFTKKNNPHLHRIITVLQVFLLTLAVCAFLFKYEIMVKLVSFLAAVSSFVIIFAAFRSLVCGYRAARFFLIAWLAFLLGGTLLVIRNFGLLPHNFFTINGMQIGIVLLIVFLSLALSERIVLLRKEHDQLVMLEQELSIAKSVQTNILPSKKYMDSIHGFELDVKFFPMNRTVSGDYYNISLLPDGGISLTVADASGHGMQAALTTMQIDLICRESQLASNPAARLDYMNKTWLEKKLSNNFFTCFIADLHGNRLQFASAGHPGQYLLCPSSKTIHELTARGQLIGFSEEALYEHNFRNIQPGDIVLLFSDGVLEEFNLDGEEYGEERLHLCLQRALDEHGRQLTPSLLNEIIFMDLTLFRKGEPVNDDITLVAAKIS